MPINPYTGQMESYDAPTMGTNIAMGAMETAGITAPLPFRMMEQSSGIPTLAGFSIFRGSNTLLRGGSRPDLFKTSATARDFFGANRGARKIAEGKSPWLRRAMQQNTPRPRNFMQFTDMSIFADPARNMYSPFTAAGFFGSSKAGRYIGQKLTGTTLTDEAATAFGGGTISAISAGVRVDRLERKALKGNLRAAAKLKQVDQNLFQLAQLNSPELVKLRTMYPTPVRGPLPAPTLPHAGAAGRLVAPNTGIVGYDYQMSSVFDDMMANKVRVADIPSGPLPMGRQGLRGNMMASLMPGEYTQQIAGYARGALGYGADDMMSVNLIRGAAIGAGKAEDRFARSFVKAFGEGTKFTARSGVAYDVTETGAKAFLRSTAGSSFFRELGFANVKKIAASGGTKMLVARGAALAVPGLQVAAAVMMAYDLAQIAGEAMKGTINLAKDAMVSLRGDITKPAFGMGYRDTEAAATSRARGVMAIQNSRLNMRSLLGSEAGMMAARYG